MTHGGKRLGAGRKPRFNEPTTPLRVPQSKVTAIKQYLAQTNIKQQETA